MAQLSDLEMDTLNANAHSEKGRASLEKSMERYGFREAGVLDRNNKIIGGNHRTEVAGELELNDIVIIDAVASRPVYIRYQDLNLDDPDNEARAIALALNKTAQDSITWDAEVLAQLASEGLELTDWFATSELDNLFSEPEPEQIDSESELASGMTIEFPSNNLADNHIIVIGETPIETFAPNVSVVLGTKIVKKTGMVDRAFFFGESGYPANMDLFMDEFTMYGDIVFAELTGEGDPLFACEKAGRRLMGWVSEANASNVISNYERIFGLEAVKKPT